MARLTLMIVCVVLIGCAYGASLDVSRKRTADLAQSLKRLAEKTTGSKRYFDPLTDTGDFETMGDASETWDNAIWSERDLHPMPKAIDLTHQLAGRAVQNTVSKRLASFRRADDDTEARDLHERAVEQVRSFGKKAAGSVNHQKIFARALDKIRATQKDINVRTPFHPAMTGLHNVARSLHNKAIREIKYKLPK